MFHSQYNCLNIVWRCRCLSVSLSGGVKYINITISPRHCHRPHHLLSRILSQINSSQNQSDEKLNYFAPPDGSPRCESSEQSPHHLAWCLSYWWKELIDIDAECGEQQSSKYYYNIDHWYSRSSWINMTVVRISFILFCFSSVNLPLVQHPFPPNITSG